jgi:rare lipoprotein A
MKYTLLTYLIIVIFFISGCQKNYPNGTPATMKAYCIRGKTYYPTYVSIGKKTKGIASWYGTRFHGRRTSSGERYNMYASTAAHKTWPMHTMVKVTNLINHKSVIVRINDRGPFVRGRVIDCSYSAGKKIGLDKRGIARVKLEVVGFRGRLYKKSKVAHKSDVPKKVKITNFGIQVGSFKDKDEAIIYKRHYALLNRKYNSIIKTTYDDNNEPLYLIFVMGFKSNQEAEDYKYCNDLENSIIIRE